MSDAQFQNAVDVISKVIDGAGVLVIVLGLMLACCRFVTGQQEPAGRAAAYRGFRQRLGQAILLGLEFLVAADIIRTVAVAPSFRGVGVLAVVVTVRTFLSFTLDLELQGHWPWQPRTAGSAPRSPEAQPGSGPSVGVRDR